MADINNTGATTAPRSAARNAAMMDERPGDFGTEASKVYQQVTHRKARSHDCERPPLAGQQIAVRSAPGEVPVLRSAATMSTRAIAELTGKEHRNVLADVRAMLDALGQDVLSFQQMLPDAYGRMQPVFALPKDLTLTLVAGYSVPMRHRIIVRWQELEDGALPPRQPAVPASFREALLLAADQQAVIERQAEQIAIAAPKAAALDLIAEADESFTITDAAKGLRMRPSALFAWLESNQWIYRRKGSKVWSAHQRRLEAGLLEQRVRTVTLPDGTEKIETQARVTGKGMTRLALQFAAGSAQAQIPMTLPMAREPA